MHLSIVVFEICVQTVNKLQQSKNQNKSASLRTKASKSGCKLYENDFFKALSNKKVWSVLYHRNQEIMEKNNQLKKYLKKFNFFMSDCP